MKKIVYVLLSGFVLVAGNAQAGFVGPYSFANWTKTVDGGSITTNSINDSVTLVSSDDQPILLPDVMKDQDFTITILADSVINFHWQYDSEDYSSQYDPFGYLLNNSFRILTDEKITPPAQQGVHTVTVFAGDIFGFRINSLDSKFGAGTAIITNFSAVTNGPAQVPLPAAVWLFGTALFGFLWQAKRATPTLDA